MARLLGRKLEYGELAKVGAQREYLPILSFNPNESDVSSTTSTTWENMLSLQSFLIVWEDLQLKGAELWINHLCRLENDTAGETTYARLYNNMDDEALTGSEITNTGTTAKYKESGWFQYTPATIDSPIWIFTQGKVTGGTGDVRIDTVLFALKL